MISVGFSNFMTLRKNRIIKNIIMKNWNNTGKIKAALLLVIFIICIIMPLDIALHGEGTTISIIGFIFGSVAVPLITRINAKALKQEIVKPDWNANPFNLKLPLNFYLFGGFFFLIAGLGWIIGSAIRLHPLNDFGLFNITFGIGLLIGVFITYLFRRTKE
jgi:hypothetical protein